MGPLRAALAVLGGLGAVAPVNADMCGDLGLVTCGEPGAEVCAMTCPDERTLNACEYLGLVMCGDGEGEEVVCAMECPDEARSPDEVCAHLGLTACGEEGVCAMECPDETLSSAEMCELLGLTPCASDTPEDIVCAPECPNDGEDGTDQNSGPCSAS
eukprot:COSAG02_NODE_22623_length_746_cov_0.981453_1_plen_156_part_01